VNKTILLVVLGMGWVFFALILSSNYFFNKFSISPEASSFNPITWENHMQLFNGAVQCNLIEEELLERKKLLKETIFSNVQRRVESSDGITYYFDDEADLIASVLEHVQIEKACCPFFKFDISILPFNNGFALKISGSEEAIEMIKGLESEES